MALRVILPARAPGQMGITLIADPSGTLVVKYEQHVAPLLARNRALYNEGAPRSDWMRPVASIPPIVYHRWLREYGVDLLDEDHRPAVRRLLNSPEWRYLRTAPGWVA